MIPKTKVGLSKFLVDPEYQVYQDKPIEQPVKPNIAFVKVDGKFFNIDGKLAGI